MSENNNINIGNDNKITKSKIGSFKNTKNDESSASKISGCIIKILTAIIATAVGGVFLQWLLQFFNLL